MDAFRVISPLYRVWSALPGRKSRGSLDPLALGGSLLPHLCLGHYLGDGADLRYDLIGSVIQKLAPRLAPGSLASETMVIQKTERDHILELFLQTGINQDARVFEIRYNSVERIPLRIYAAMFPLGIAPTRLCAEDLLIGVWRTDVDCFIGEDNSVDLTGEFLAYADMHGPR